MSHLWAASMLATTMESSPSKPFGIPSVALMRTFIGRSSGQVARHASNTSSGKRMRFSIAPLYCDQRMSVQLGGEQLLQERHGIGLGRRVQPSASPSFVSALNVNVERPGSN